jgi:hypothetical protein
MPNPIPALRDAVELAKTLDTIDTVSEAIDACLAELGIWVKLNQPMPLRCIMKLERQLQQAKRYQKAIRSRQFKVHT